MARPSLREVFMRLAEVWSERSTCSSRASVGCVIVNDFYQVIASGYNGSPHGVRHCDEVGCDLDGSGHCVRSVHAEMNAILQCARVGVSCNGAIMYCTSSPCIRCANAIVNAGIKSIWYKDIYREDTDYKVVLRILTEAGVYMYHYPEDKHVR